MREASGRAGPATAFTCALPTPSPAGHAERCAGGGGGATGARARRAVPRRRAWRARSGARSAKAQQKNAHPSVSSRAPTPQHVRSAGGGRTERLAHPAASSPRASVQGAPVALLRWRGGWRPLLSGGTPVRLRWCVPQARGRLWAARPCSLTCPLHVRERVPALTRHARSLRCPVALRRHARALYSLGPGHWVGGGAAVAALRAWCGAHVPGRSRSARAGRDAQQERHRGGVEAALRCLRGCAS